MVQMGFNSMTVALPSIHKALGLILSTTKREKESYKSQIPAGKRPFENTLDCTESSRAIGAT